ncbi:MAG: PD40 domain-containing protein, partial [Chloroflexi bacterium]|nr:PD40 domain-containing protein [Chloroflexota bacterium]
MNKLTKLAAFFGLSILLVACAAPTPAAGHPPQIAYVGNDGLIYVLNLESRAIRAMSGEGNFAFADPVWSPDGEYLAFVTGGDPWAEGNEIWVAAADGSWSKKLADGYAPEWAPDGRLLFISNFQMSEEGAAQSISLVDVESGAAQELVSQLWQGGFWPLEEARYSADGEWLAIYANGLEAEGSLFVLPAAGGEPFQIAQFVYEAGNYAWSPQGHLLALRDSGQPFRGDGEPSLLVLDPEEGRSPFDLRDGYFWPRWSPDGERLTFFQIQDGGGFQVWTVAANGAALARINEETFQSIWGTDPSWSPGEGILFNRLVDAETGEVGVYIMDPEDGQTTLLTQGENPQARWSPDGAKVAIALGR